ncbi:MAG: hypothetical protein O2904_04645 [bacterium]|nr:hypothetical protein [bacterium]
MNEEDVRKKCEEFVQGLGVPCFLVFGWKKEEAEQKVDRKKNAAFGMVSSYHKMPSQAVIKGMSWALNDIVNKSM